LIASTKTIDAKGDALAGFIAATLRAMDEIKDKPEVGLDAAIKQVPDLAADRDTQAAILDATIEVWSGPAQQANGLGAIEPADWQKSVEYLTTLGLVPKPVATDDLIDTGLLPGAH
jgi:ABC-type nitrate/sulfonate/bicarbonate transport system substrate-binding protein